MVVFSDFVSEEEHKEYSKVSVYLKDNKTPTQFRRTVEKAHYFGYRTRIDLGFQLAEKDVFNVRHGARPNGVKKVCTYSYHRIQNKVINSLKVTMHNPSC